MSDIQILASVAVSPTGEPGDTSGLTVPVVLKLLATVRDNPGAHFKEIIVWDDALSCFSNIVVWTGSPDATADHLNQANGGYTAEIRQILREIGEANRAYHDTTNLWIPKADVDE